MEIFGVNAPLFWFIMGVAFFVMEALTPGFVLFFFGLGAWASALVMLFLPFPAVFQWLIFSAVSIVTLVFMRNRLRSLFTGRMAKNDNMEDPVVTSQYIGKEVLALSEIAPGRPGLVELYGTNWQARVEDELTLNAGDRATVRKIDGLTLIIGR